MEFVLRSMPAWVVLAGLATAGMVMIGSWRKKRRRIYSRELMQKLARAL